MFDNLPEHQQHTLERLARRLNSYTGSVVIKSKGASVFCVVAANDVSLLRQAYFGPMNRSSRRKLRERLFEKSSSVELDEELVRTLEENHSGDESRPFLQFYFGKDDSSKYAVLRVQNLAYMEYFLYVSQYAFRETIYRRI